MIAIMLGCWLAAWFVFDPWAIRYSWRNKIADILAGTGIGIGLYLTWQYLP